MARLHRWLQRWAINLITKHLFDFVSFEELLRKQNGMLLVRGRRLDDAEVEAMSKDALAFKDSIIWKVLTNEVKYHCYTRLVPRSTTADDLLEGKAMLKCLEIIDNKLIELSS